jgi:predicted transcriptional regulator
MSDIRLPFPLLDKGEQAILEEIRGQGGDIFRTELRRRIEGSNTTFQKRISNLIEKGMIEEYKREDGRRRTAYRLSDHASSVFNLERILAMDKWFSASQRIELFPEFDQASRILMPASKSAYEILGIKPQHLIAETILAVNKPPKLRGSDLGDALTLCNATLQNIATGRLHQTLEGEVEGYIVFHYKLWKPEQELGDQVNDCMTRYLNSDDPLERHRASSRLIEVALRNSNFLDTLTLIAASAAKSFGVATDPLLKAYRTLREHKAESKHDRILTVTEVVLTSLDIFRQLREAPSKGGTNSQAASA